MDEFVNEIRVVYPDTVINTLLASIPDNSNDASFVIRYNHSEELFIEIDADITMPSFPIHHDIHTEVPSATYAYALKSLISQLVDMIPGVFKGLTYYFDPSEPLKPHFYKLYKIDDSLYLFLLRIDLVFRHFQGEIIKAGSNDMTPAFQTRRLFMESEFIPLDAVMWELGKARAFKVKQLISNTWIGETGRGYLLHGIWMDNDLSKFFSKLMLPDGARTYPYYPLFCKYKTICAEALPPDSDRRKHILPLLHRSISLFAPEMEKIQNALRDPSGFSESIPIFIDIRNRIPSAWKETLKGVTMRSYLNESDLKEYALEITDTKS
jgi:hypothetical protein